MAIALVAAFNFPGVLDSTSAMIQLAGRSFFASPQIDFGLSPSSFSSVVIESIRKSRKSMILLSSNRDLGKLMMKPRFSRW